jgi:hypothetical protein
MTEVGIAAFDRTALAEPPAELWSFAKKETSHQRCGHERRRQRRFSLITNVIAVPLTRDFCPAGEPFVAVSSGMSIGGMRLIHTAPAPSEFLLLEIDRQPVKLLLTVLRSRPVGPCFEIAGRLTPAGQAGLLMTDSVGPAGQPGEISAANDDHVQWAGLSAAVEIIKPNWDSHDQVFQFYAGSDSSH